MTKVVATADGVVHGADFHKGYGNYVLIDHGGEYMTRYSQLDSFSVKKGEQVKKGQQIALSGNSGRSTGPHIHYEVVMVGTGYVDPLDYIENYDFAKVKSGKLDESANLSTDESRRSYQQKQIVEEQLQGKVDKLDKRNKKLAKEENLNQESQILKKQKEHKIQNLIQR